MRRRVSTFVVILPGRGDQLAAVLHQRRLRERSTLRGCQSLVDSYKATAKQAADLAKAHREMATAK